MSHARLPREVMFIHHTHIMVREKGRGGGRAWGMVSCVPSPSQTPVPSEKVQRSPQGSTACKTKRHAKHKACSKGCRPTESCKC